jgi:hypothetical protein
VNEYVVGTPVVAHALYIDRAGCRYKISRDQANRVFCGLSLQMTRSLVGHRYSIVDDCRQASVPESRPS